MTLQKDLCNRFFFGFEFDTVEYVPIQTESVGIRLSVFCLF